MESSADERCTVRGVMTVVWIFTFDPTALCSLSNFPSVFNSDFQHVSQYGSTVVDCCVGRE